MMPGVTIAQFIASLEATETWRAVAGWPYEVSSWGNVRRTGSPLMLKPSLSRGYFHVTFSHQGVQTNARLHALVAHAFLGPPPFANAVAAHNDGNSENNRVGNLRWASGVENQADRDRHGTKVRGSEVFGAKLTEADIPVITRRVRSGERYSTIACDYGVSISTISLIKKNRIWRHATEGNGHAG